MSEFTIFPDIKAFKDLLKNAQKKPARNCIIKGNKNLITHVEEPLSELWQEAIQLGQALETMFNQVVTPELPTVLTTGLIIKDDKADRALRAMIALHKKLINIDHSNSKQAFGVAVLGSDTFNNILQGFNPKTTLVRSFQMSAPFTLADQEKVKSIRVSNPLTEHPEINWGDLVYYTNLAKAYVPQSNLPPQCTVSLFVTEVPRAG